MRYLNPNNLEIAHIHKIPHNRFISQMSFKIYYFHLRNFLILSHHQETSLGEIRDKTLIRLKAYPLMISWNHYGGLSWAISLGKRIVK
jgi:hypothetical protein